MKKRIFYNGTIITVSVFMLMMLQVLPVNAVEVGLIKPAYENRIRIGAANNPASGAFFNGLVTKTSGANTLLLSAFGQPFGSTVSPDAEYAEALKVMYEGTIDPTTGIKSPAAFEYKQYLYGNEGGKLTALFENVSSYWDAPHSEKAVQAQNIIKNALMFVPYHRGLRWALLDVCYETAVAELQIAKEKRVKAYQASLGIGVTPPPGEFLISEEIK